MRKRFPAILGVATSMFVAKSIIPAQPQRDFTCIDPGPDARCLAFAGNEAGRPPHDCNYFGGTRCKMD